ncbi:MAG: anhydro-N-acetylmuramic acid kinase [Rhodospirillales bacterium]|nr:anhydro-N-acetylmuramic acid kinase [Rhodospirillales bacterium]
MGTLPLSWCAKLLCEAAPFSTITAPRQSDPNMTRPLRSLGLMSGTSLDGVDAALLTTDGDTIAGFGAWLTVPYEPAFRQRLRGVLGGRGDIAPVERELTLIHAGVVRRLLAEAGLNPAEVDLIGFHGHTILHRPERRRTWQIGDGGLLARETRIAVINDFRSADVRAGGQGAPLVPLFHAALAKALTPPLAVLNLGGVGNVSFLGSDGRLSAFDTGPGNALIDDWVLRHTGRSCDEDGALARQGIVKAEAVAAFRAHPYFSVPPPKSLDRDDFSAFALGLAEGLAPADGAATLTAFTAAAVACGLAHLPEKPRRWLACGGGRLNPVLMQALREALGVPVEAVEAVGWQGDALEAQAFAYLAVRSLRGLPLTLPETTGGPEAMTGGALHEVSPL